MMMSFIIRSVHLNLSVLLSKADMMGGKCSKHWELDVDGTITIH
jgi:hypothetical protein